MRPLKLNSLCYFNGGAVAVIDTDRGAAVYDSQGVAALLRLHQEDEQTVWLLRGILRRIFETNPQELPDIDTENVQGQGVGQGAIDFSQGEDS